MFGNVKGWVCILNVLALHRYQAVMQEGEFSAPAFN